MFLCVTTATSASLSEWYINVNVVLQTSTVRSRSSTHPFVRSFVRSYAHRALKSSASSNHIQILRVSVFHGVTFVHTSDRQTMQPPHHVVRSVQATRSAATLLSPILSSVTIHLDC
ncbi:hypothetical protein WUBG_14841 [Wuchereria bancrofti]|uniref:Uncharacterized protein n=1 Tax=Wuchereria bancrofti TaxID=6293 RepID=J9AJ84_WUCBA|nr:hypothetical protein WUBG_16674 [Wuchereria bancrofti]EJW74250.1 hypothetical protein WUBG_14841 [Wuchereria bancrofti]